MTPIFDSETIEALRALPPAEVFARVREVLFRSGATTSEEFREAYEELVERGLLTWDQVEALER